MNPSIVWDWLNNNSPAVTTITTSVSLFISIFALCASYKGIKENNKEALFERRLTILLLIEDLLRCQKEADPIIRHENSEFFQSDIAVAYLTNCIQLQDVITEYGNIDNYAAYTNWLSKIHLLKHYAEESYCVFKEDNTFEQYLVQYADLMQDIYKYKICINNIQKNKDEELFFKTNENALKDLQQIHKEILHKYNVLKETSAQINIHSVRKKLKFG